MKTNFKIIENYAIEYKDVHIDLHNNYDFLGLTETKDELKLLWQKNSGEWVPKDAINKFEIIFRDITYKSIVEGQIANGDDKTLMSLTYYPSQDRDNNEHLVDMCFPDKNSDIIFKFESDKIIRIQSNEIQFHIK